MHSLIVRCLGYVVTRYLILLTKGTHRSSVAGADHDQRLLAIGWKPLQETIICHSLYCFSYILFGAMEYNLFFMAFIEMATNEMKS